MKDKNMKRIIRISAFLLSCILFSSAVCPVQATSKLDQLKDSASKLESELSDLEKDLDTLDSEIDWILTKIENTDNELENIREELALAKGQEEEQYEMMVVRIKHMYENGNHTILEMLLTSTCIAEFISRAEFYSAINEYDRKMLEQYAANAERIAEKEAMLLETAQSLASMQEELESKEKAVRSKISNASEELSSYTTKIEKAKEEAKKAEQQAKEEITPIKPAKPDKESSSSSTVTSTPGVSYTEDDVILLAALIECEAGSSHYEGMLAVGSVVVNRMKSRYYPNTLQGVVYQTGQFPPAHDGKVDRVLNRGVKSSCVTAARDALNGKNNVGNCVSFRAASSGRPGTVIGDNVFF